MGQSPYEDKYSKAIAIKSEEYKEYIDKHIANVKKAFEQYGEEIAKLCDVSYDLLAKNIEVHDQSKYSDEEFDGYRKYFYPAWFEEKNKESNKEDMNRAFKHHAQVNAHHPEFWIVLSPSGEPIATEMSRIAVAEMLLDWKAMERNDSTIKDYYETRAYKDHMFHPGTIELIDRVIPTLF